MHGPQGLSRSLTIQVRALIRVYERLIPGLSGTMIIVGGTFGPSFCVPLWKMKDPVVGTVPEPNRRSHPLASPSPLNRSGADLGA